MEPVLILGATTEKRWKVLKDVPAIAEELPGFTNVAWTALSVPAATPPAVVAKLHSVLNHVLQQPDTKAKWYFWGADVAIGDGQDVRKLVERDAPLWARFAKKANISAE